MIGRRFATSSAEVDQAKDVVDTLHSLLAELRGLGEYGELAYAVDREDEYPSGASPAALEAAADSAMASCTAVLTAASELKQALEAAHEPNILVIENAYPLATQMATRAAITLGRIEGVLHRIEAARNVVRQVRHVSSEINACTFNLQSPYARIGEENPEVPLDLRYLGDHINPLLRLTDVIEDLSPVIADLAEGSYVPDARGERGITTGQLLTSLSSGERATLDQGLRDVMKRAHQHMNDLDDPTRIDQARFAAQEFISAAKDSTVGRVADGVHKVWKVRKDVDGLAGTLGSLSVEAPGLADGVQSIREATTATVDSLKAADQIRSTSEDVRKVGEWSQQQRANTLDELAGAVQNLNAVVPRDFGPKSTTAQVMSALADGGKLIGATADPSVGGGVKVGKAAKKVHDTRKAIQREERLRDAREEIDWADVQQRLRDHWRPGSRDGQIAWR